MHIVLELISTDHLPLLPIYLHPLPSINSRPPSRPTELLRPYTQDLRFPRFGLIGPLYEDFTSTDDFGEGDCVGWRDNWFWWFGDETVDTNKRQVSMREDRGPRRTEHQKYEKQSSREESQEVWQSDSLSSCRSSPFESLCVVRAYSTG